MNAPILIVEDEPDVLAVLEETVALGGYESRGLLNGRDVVHLLETEPFDAVLMDLGLPDMAGDDLLAATRAASDLPIIVISGRASEQDKVRALDLGADDYLAKPFLPGELLARIRAAIRRSAARPAASLMEEAPPVRRVGGLALDPMFRTAAFNGRTVSLTEAEFKLLDTLAEHQSRPVPRDVLQGALYGPGELRQTKIIEVFIGRIRRKLANLTDGDELIDTLRGRGWILRAPQ